MSEFGTLNLDEMQGEGERLNRTPENFLDQFVPMPQGKGTVVVRLLPPMKGGKVFQYTRIHSVNDRKIHCPRPLISGKWDNTVKCPICEYYSYLWREIDKAKRQGGDTEALMKEARSLKPVERYYYNAIVRSMTVDGEVLKNVGPRILSVGKLLHQKIISGMIGDEHRRGLGDVTRPGDGYDFIIKKTLKGEFPDYAESSFTNDQSPLGTPDEVEKWCQQLNDLTKLRSLKDQNTLEREVAIHRGYIKEEVTGFDPEAMAAKYRDQDEEVPVSAPVVVETSVVEDTSIDDDDFMKSIEELKAAQG